MKKSKRFYPILTGLGLLLAGLVVLYVVFRSWQKSKAMEQDKETDLEPIPMETSEDTIIVNAYKVTKEACESSEVVNDNFVRFLTAQAMHESDVYSSEIYADCNNAYGMRQPSHRQTTSKGESNTHASYATYASLADSVRDRILWQQFNSLPVEYPNMDKESVVSFVRSIKDKSYFTDNFLTYQNAVYAHLRRLNNILNRG